ncbi:hypothetical protein EG328_008180 [Venturia inaequalis]|uniref:Uncharacterized protein n=1 Tax=Venturia inaequalis TaxID=5025 RepID=A0A8H3UD46_VENIN|nr:hypothetical protein EG328_008180 [Venturia inaequalis]
MSNEQHGPQIPQTVDTASQLYQILRLRLRDLNLYMMRSPPGQCHNNDEANRCKEALKLWANNIGVEKGVLAILDEHKTWNMRNDMFDLLWALHSAVEDMEVAVGWRPMRADKKPARARPFEYFHSLIYTYSQDTERFSSLAITYPHYKTSNSTPTPPPVDRIDTLERPHGSHVLLPTPSEKAERAHTETANPNHFRNDSHTEYIKKEEQSKDGGYTGILSPADKLHAFLSDLIHVSEYIRSHASTLTYRVVAQSFGALEPPVFLQCHLAISFFHR